MFIPFPKVNYIKIHIRSGNKLFIPFVRRISSIFLIFFTHLISWLLTNKKSQLINYRKNTPLMKQKNILNMLILSPKTNKTPNFLTTNVHWNIKIAFSCILRVLLLYFKQPNWFKNWKIIFIPFVNVNWSLIPVMDGNLRNILYVKGNEHFFNFLKA